MARRFTESRSAHESAHPGPPRGPPPAPARNDSRTPGEHSAAQVRRAVHVDDRAGGEPGARARRATARRRRPPRGARPGRCGDCARTSSPRGPSSTSRAMSVSTNPGATVPTEMPCGASACAIDWPNAFRPGLGRAVGRAVRLAAERAAAGDVDDRSAAAGHQVRHRAERRVAPRRSGWSPASASTPPATRSNDVRQRRVRQEDAGVVDQHVEPVEPGGRLVDGTGVRRRRRSGRPAPAGGPRPGSPASTSSAASRGTGRSAPRPGRPAPRTPRATAAPMPRDAPVTRTPPAHRASSATPASSRSTSSSEVYGASPARTAPASPRPIHRDASRA